jgi:hypothetical protein
MDESERTDFELLVQILDEELNAQVGVKRPHETDEQRHQFAVLLADAVWDRFRPIDRLQ